VGKKARDDLMKCLANLEQAAWMGTVRARAPKTAALP